MALETRSRQSDRSEKRSGMRDRLLAAAEELMGEGLTFSEISIDRLSSAAGVTRTTFYVYFEDKADVLLAWLEAIVDDIEDAATAWWSLDGPVTRERLSEVVGQVFAQYQPHAAVLASAYDSSLFDAAVDEAFQAMMDRNIARLEDHIRRGQGAGWINASLSPHETATWLGWMVQRGQHTAFPADEDERGRVLDTYVGVLWNTLYRP